jgi:hypothetical protein
MASILVKERIDCEIIACPGLIDLQIAGRGDLPSSPTAEALKALPKQLHFERYHRFSDCNPDNTSEVYREAIRS